MISWLKEQVRSIISAWNWFWFESRSDDSLVPLAVFRISFCAVMLFAYFTRMLDAEFFFSSNGILPSWHIKNVDFFKYHPNLITDGWSISAILALHGLFLALLFSHAIGFFTRYAAIGAYILHMVFINRNMAIQFGVDTIGTFYFLYLCFADTNSRFSIDAWRGKAVTRQSVRSHIALRLMQIQLCVVYGYSGLEKLRGTRWWDGSALWDVMAISTMQRWDLSFVANFPVLLALGVYVVLLWEIYFPAVIWLKKFRLPMLFFGFLMHIGIYLFLNLPSFGFMMIALYFLFLSKEEILHGLNGLKKYLLLIRPKHS